MTEVDPEWQIVLHQRPGTLWRAIFRARKSTMVAFGYLVYLVRAAKPHNTGQLYRMNAAGDNAEDLLKLVDYNAKTLGVSYHKQPKASEGFRVKKSQAKGRTHWVHINKGPEGVPGETYDLDTNTSTPTTERIALLSGLRAMFALPLDSYYGLLFVERIGGRHLKETLRDQIVSHAASQSGSMIRLESFAELKDWKTLLSGLQAVRISETLAVKDVGDDASTVKDTTVRIVADGASVMHATDHVFSVITDKITRRDQRLEVLIESSKLGESRRAAEQAGVTFQDEGEYQALLTNLRELNSADEENEALTEIVDGILPVDRSGLEHKGFDVQVGATGTSRGRTFSIETDAIPQFVYELNARPTDAVLRQAWVDHAETILKARGVSLPVGWAT